MHPRSVQMAKQSYLKPMKEAATSYSKTQKDDTNNWSTPLPIDNINNFGDSTDLIGGPSISFDGNTLYFFASIGMGNSSDIYISKRIANGWSEPETLGAPINTSDYEGFPSISADGNTLYFVRNHQEGPQDRELQKKNLFCYAIYKSELEKDGQWGEPTILPAPINQDCEKAPKIMADGKTLIFSSLRPGGIGDYDMYQSKVNVLDEWSYPAPLDYVNTQQSDQLPCIAAEGDLMYYVYNNQDIYSVVIPPSLRQFVNNVIQGYITDEDTEQGIDAKIIVTDAYTSEVLMEIDNNPIDGRYSIILPVGKNYNVEIKKEGYSSFTFAERLLETKKYKETSKNISLFKTVNLVVNVSDVELFEPVPAAIDVKIQGASSYFKEQKNDPLTGRALINLPIGDRYEIVINAENFKSEFFHIDLSGLVIYRDFEKEVELAPEKIQVMINVADLTNNAKVKSKIVLKNKNRDEYIEVSGNEMVSLRAGDRYEIEATSDEGYAFNSTLLDVSKDNQNKVDIKLQKLEANARLTLKDINFESNSAYLTDISYVELQRVMKLMTENPSLRVEIAAHSDDIGSDRYNEILSDKRAESVVAYLIDNNIPASRFVARGYGESQPKVPNENEANRAINRRVELKILGI